MNSEFAFLVTGMQLILSIGIANSQAPGTLDPSFGVNGVQTLQPSNNFENAYSIELLSNGQMLIGGGSQVSGPGNWDIIVYRLNSDGSVDNTFGNNGFAYTDYNGYSQYTRTMKRLPNGKLLFVGAVEDNTFQVDVMATLLNDDGTPDINFSGDGTQIISLGSGEDVGNAAVIQPDGKIVIAGEAAVPGFIYQNGFLLRLLPDGSPDNSFGNAGVVTIDNGYDYESLQDLVLLDDGSIIATGYVGQYTYDLLAVKADSNGVLDSSFGNNGAAIFNLNSGDDVGYSITRHHLDNRILIGGRIGAGGSGTDLLVLAVTDTGTIDVTFGVNGIARMNNNVNETGLDLAVQNNGKIVLGGTSGGAGLGANDFAICRFTQNGTIDSVFGTNGFTLSVISTFFSSIEDIALQPDGKILAAGFAANTNNDMGIARYFGDSVLITGQGELMNENETQFAIYPNPTSGNFSIYFNSGNVIQEEIELKIYNLFGQIIHAENLAVVNGVLLKTFDVSEKGANTSCLVVIRAGDDYVFRKLIIQR